MGQYNRLLSYKEFLSGQGTERGQTGYNLIGCWVGGLCSLVYEKQKAVTIFKRRHTHLDEILTREVQKPHITYRLHSDPKLKRLLYTAYRLMHKYGARNEDILR